MAAFPIAAALTAGGSVLSSLLAPKPKTISPRKQILSTVKGAREAGIHPLAALGANAGYTTVGSGSNVGSAIGEGMEKFGAMLATQKSQAEIDALKADTDARRAQAELYRSQSRTLISRTASAARGGPPTDDQPPKPIKMFGVPITRDPTKFSKAQDAQDEFGDIVEQLVGIPSFVHSGTQKMLEYVPTDAQLLEAAKRWYKRNQGPASFGPSP